MSGPPQPSRLLLGHISWCGIMEGSQANISPRLKGKRNPTILVLESATQAYGFQAQPKFRIQLLASSCSDYQL